MHVRDTASERWSRLSALPVVVESYEFERLTARLAFGVERVTTRIRLRGAGFEGLGEDVSPVNGEHDALHVCRPVLALVGEWSLGALCAHIAELDQWPVRPRWETTRRWRTWAFEAAAVDLALNQAGLAFHEFIDREPRPVRFVNSVGLGEPPTFDPIRRRLDRHAELHFKLDATPSWTPDLVNQLAATGSVEIIDFKGHYGPKVRESPALILMYQRVVKAFPNALLEDPHDLPGVAELLESEAHRISYDAPIRSARDLDATPMKPRAVNVKPCRLGDLRSLLDLYSACERRHLMMYGGGMEELDVGRGQIELLASLFHPDTPNDVAPAGYNADALAPDLPSSPLAAEVAPTGFRLTL
jgi:hypothetical protein